MLLGSTSAGGNSFSFLFGRFLFVFSVLFCVVLCCCFFFTIFYQLAGSNLFILHPLITVARGVAINVFLV